MIPAPLSPDARRHLQAYTVSRRLGGTLAIEIDRVLKSVTSQLEYLENRPNDLASLVRTAVIHLRRKLPELLNNGLNQLAVRYYLRVAQMLTAKARQGNVKEDAFGRLLNLEDYDNLIIPPPSFDFLQRLIGPAPANLTRLIKPDDAANQVFAGISQGWDRRQIIKALEKTFGGFEVSARRISRTTGLHVATMTQLAASEEIPDLIAGYQINAVLDERTRPEHYKRDGTRYWRNPKKGQLGFEDMPQPPFDIVRGTQVLAFNCLLPGSLVQGRFVRGWKAGYAGDAVELVCASGSVLRITANHPVLTIKGFIPANSIAEGDYVGHYESGIQSVQHEQDKPALVEDVFRSLSKIARAVAARPASAMEFHGDAAFFNSNVDIAHPNGELTNGLNPGGSKRVDQCLLVGRGVSELAEPRFSPLGFNFQRIDLTTPGLVCSRDLLAPFTGLDPTPFGLFGLGLATEDNTSVLQPPVYDVSRDAECIRQLVSRFASVVSANQFIRRQQDPLGAALITGGDYPLLERLPLAPDFAGEDPQRLASKVSADEVIKVRRFHYSGPVYDLESDTGYYTAGLDGRHTYISNCRCYLSPLFGDPEIDDV